MKRGASVKLDHLDVFWRICLIQLNTDVIFSAKPTLWDVEFANRLSLVNNQLPRNRFEEMIQWTKEGKLWQYPINNETGES